MIKLLHGADFHLDSPFTGRTEEERRFLRQKLLEIPEKAAQVCRNHQCDLVLLAGDIFDGPASKESVTVLKAALEHMQVPVFVAPGNHDFCGPDSPWIAQQWPGNVHVFTKQIPESVGVPALDCRIYGAGFQGTDCPGVLKNFRAEGKESFHIGVFHADPTQISSPYCPVTAPQVRDSGLSYLGLGHIHKIGMFRAGSTLCAWPGCPMGRGFDETGEKGLLLVKVGETASAEPVILDTPQFYDLTRNADGNPEAALERCLPATGNQNFYRITLTGYTCGGDISELYRHFHGFPHLEIVNRMLPETELWGNVQEDSLEGVYFRKLKQMLEEEPAEEQNIIRLAAEISRQILDGQEVMLP